MKKNARVEIQIWLRFSPKNYLSFHCRFCHHSGEKHPNLLQLLLFPEVSHKKTVIQKPFTMQLTLNLKCFNKLEIGSQKN